ncbi:hypothetical protein [Persephonella sp.]
MNENIELAVTIVIFILAVIVIAGLMIYWSKNNTIVDERDRKYYQNDKNNDINH